MPAVRDARRLIASPEDRRARLLDCALLAILFVAPLLALRPLQNAPFVDDWTYAWSVEHLLSRGELRLLEWSTQWNVGQVAWGALFCLPFGFSFTALRLSTLVLGAGCVAGLYWLQRDLGVARPKAILGAATLAVNPLFAILSVTFMTDVPAVATAVWAAVAGVAALRTEKKGALGLAVGLAALSCATRIVGVAACGALALALLRRDPATGGRPRIGAALFALSPVALVALAEVAGKPWIVAPADVSLILAAPGNRWEALREALPSLPRTLPMLINFAAAGIGVALLPLSLAAIGRGRGARALAFAAGLVAVLSVSRWMRIDERLPLFGVATWTLDELGATAPLIAGYVPPAIPGWALLVAGVALASCAAWLAWAIRRPSDGATALLLWTLAGHLGLIALLWLFYDRYGLILVPPAIALFATARVPVRRAVAIAVLLALEAVAIAGVHDHLALSRALWDGVAWLQARGVPTDQIDGGYIVNGWLQYAHAENAPRDAAGRVFVPDLTVERGTLRYQLALRDLPGWTPLARLPFARWLAADGAIVVLERRDAP